MRNREPGQKFAVIARGFGISESCLTNWIRQSHIKGAARPIRTREESSELRDARKRIRHLEQENEVLHRTAVYLLQANLRGKRFYLPVSELADDGVLSGVPAGPEALPDFRWRNQEVTQSARIEAYRANALFDTHCVDPEFGYRFLAGGSGGHWPAHV